MTCMVHRHLNIMLETTTKLRSSQERCNKCVELGLSNARATYYHIILSVTCYNLYNNILSVCLSLSCRLCECAFCLFPCLLWVCRFRWCDGGCCWWAVAGCWCLASLRVRVSCLVLSCLVLPCLALPCLALPCLALPCLALSCLVLSCLVLSCLVLSCLVLSCLVLSCLVLSCLVLSCLVLSCLVLSCLVLSCLVLSCLVLSCLVCCVLRVVFSVVVFMLCCRLCLSVITAAWKKAGVVAYFLGLCAKENG